MAKRGTSTHTATVKNVGPATCTHPRSPRPESMARKECAQCVEHARLHSGNWLGIGRDNNPCPPCEDHAENGCPGINRKRGT